MMEKTGLFLVLSAVSAIASAWKKKRERSV